MSYALLHYTQTWGRLGLPGLALLAGNLSALPAAAQSADATQVQSAPAAGTGDSIAWLEKSRTYTRSGATALVSTVDSWFGDKPFAASGGEVSGYLRLGGLWKQHDGTNAMVRFRLRAHLPNLQNKAYVFVGRDNEVEEVKDQPEAFTREQLLQRENRNQDHSFFAGIGYGVRDNVDFRLGVHGGWKLYAQARYRQQWALSARDTVFFRESVFWSVHEHLGSTTVLDYERQLTPSLVLRWSNVGTITQRSHTLEWQSSLGLHKTLPGLRSVGMELLTEGRGNRRDLVEYGVRASWSQPLYRDWLIGKVTLGHFWPKDEAHQPRQRAWAVGAHVDMHF